jgi:predicted Ser/Thr protein kinase
MEPLNSKDPKSIGGFTLVGRLGKGGMGVVYLASRKSESVALKVIRDSLIDDESEATRFSREVATLEQISSANVARIVDSGVEDGRAWFAAEFVNGPNLSELVNDKGSLEEDQWWDLARGLLNGLADVHTTGTIHRDIKPANLIIAETGPKLIDFGIAHVSDATSVTATGLVAGSPAWFSPEQIEGLELTPATDVFSAGSVLTFAASGSSPWGGETTMTKASVFKILTSEPDLSALSEGQSFLIQKMLEKEPDQRPTAASLLANLEAIRDGKEPELESGYAPSSKKASDATTVTKRNVLNQTAQAAKPQATKSAQSATTSGAVATSTKKRNWLIIAAVSVIAVLGVSILVANSSGSGKVTVAVSVDNANPAVGDFALRLSSGSIEPVELDLDDKQRHNAVFTWKSGEPIRVAYDPPFSEDEEFVGTIMPSDLGLNGFSNGQFLYIQVSLERTSTLLSFRTGSNRSSNEVYAIRLARANENAVIEICSDELEPSIREAMELHKNLFVSFEQSEKDARLDGERTLTSSVWRSRFTDLAGRLSTNRELADQSYSSYDPSLQAVGRVNQAALELEQSVAEFVSLTGRYINAYIPDEPWDEAWYSYYDAQDALRVATSALRPSTVAKSECQSTIE